MKSLLTGQTDFVGKVWYNLGLSRVWASPLTFTYISICGLLFFSVLKILSHLLDASHLHHFHWRRSLCDTRQETGRPAPSLEELVKSRPSCVDRLNESIVPRHRFHMLHPQKRFEHLRLCGFDFFFLVTPQGGEGRQTTNFIVLKRRKSWTIKAERLLFFLYMLRMDGCNGTPESAAQTCQIWIVPVFDSHAAWEQKEHFNILLWSLQRKPLAQKIWMNKQFESGQIWGPLLTRSNLPALTLMSDAGVSSHTSRFLSFFVFFSPIC